MIQIGWGYPVLWGLEINDFFVTFLYSFGKTGGDRKHALEFIVPHGLCENFQDSISS